MKNKILNLFKVAIFLMAIFLFTNISYAYDVDTHTLLTKETVEFFNANY
jgi:hypothetical protein